MKIFIVGADNVGKSTVAGMLGNRLGFPVAETGDVLVEQLARINSGREGMGCDREDLKSWMLKITCQKERYRPQLAALGDLMTNLDPRCLVEQCARSAKIIVGVRRRREVIPFVMKGIEKKNIWIKVRGHNRCGLVRSSVFELGPYDFDYGINNFGDLSWLRVKVLELADQIARRMRCA